MGRTAHVHTPPKKKHEAQDAFISDQNGTTAYVGGVGSGKTAGGALRAGMHAAKWNPGHMGVIVSPTVPMLRNVIVPELRKWGIISPEVDYKSSENVIHFPNGSTIVLESANNDRKIERLRGLNLAWAWMDEAAYHQEKVYTILNDRLRVGNYRNLYLTTTPRGFNWLFDEFGELEGEQRHVSDGQMVVADAKTAITGVSTGSNPAHPDDYIQRQEAQHSGQSYMQEISGEFVQFEGLVHPWFTRDNWVDEGELPETWDTTIYGVDWGFSNPGTCVAMLKDGDDWYVAEELYETRMTDDDHADRVSDMVDRWGAGVAYCDPAEPSNIETFKRNGIQARPAENDVTPGIQKVTALRDNFYVNSNCQSVINEFGLYRYKDDSEKDDPLKENDHLMDAIRYALFSYYSGPTITRSPGASGGKGNMYSTS